MVLANAIWPDQLSWPWIAVGVGALLLISRLMTAPWYRPRGSDNQSVGARGTAVWLSVGVGIGTAMGAATHNMGVWVGIGAALGMALVLVGNTAR
jgi:hypothetical protein